MVSNTLKEAEADTLNDILVNVQPKAVINTPADTLSDVDAATLNDTLANVDVVEWSRDNWRHTGPRRGQEFF